MFPENIQNIRMLFQGDTIVIDDGSRVASGSGGTVADIDDTRYANTTVSRPVRIDKARLSTHAGYLRPLRELRA